jgi:hypothetical protein
LGSGEGDGKRYGVLAGQVSGSEVPVNFSKGYIVVDKKALSLVACSVVIGTA